MTAPLHDHLSSTKIRRYARPLIDFIGYAAGSYTTDDYMIVSQVLDALDSEFSTFGSNTC
jgi:hypothetical protein